MTLGSWNTQAPTRKPSVQPQELFVLALHTDRRLFSAQLLSNTSTVAQKPMAELSF